MFLFEKKKEENEIIVLSHLLNVDKYYLNKSIYHISVSHKDLKQKSKKKYEKIDSQKVEELNNKFITYKMKSVFSHEIKIDNTKIYEIDSLGGQIDKINIYENNNIKKLFSIRPYFYLEKKEKSYDIYALKGDFMYTEHDDKIISVIELDNHDLIILFENREKDIYNTNQVTFEPFHITKYMLIYRLENNNYSLIQKENLYIIFLEKLSGNRFLSIFLEKVDIYSLNKNKKYSIIESFPIYNACRFHEINEGKFIFVSYKKKFSNDEDDIPYYIYTPYDEKKNYIKEKKELMMDKENENSSVIKIFCCNELFFEYETNDEKIDLSDFIVLKKKYGIIMLNNDLLIFDIFKKKNIKKYTMLYYDEGHLIILNDYKIKKWNNENDNEFIVIMNGNITLFEIKDKSEMNLEILAYCYSPKIGNNLIKVGENNRFCIIDSQNEDKKKIIYFY